MPRRPLQHLCVVFFLELDSESGEMPAEPRLHQAHQVKQLQAEVKVLDTNGKKGLNPNIASSGHNMS